MMEMYAHQAVFIKASNGRFTFITPTLAQLFNQPESDFIGKSGSDVFGEKIGAECAEKDQYILETGKSISYDWQFTIRERPYTLKVTKHRFTLAPNTPPGIIGFVEDKSSSTPTDLSQSEKSSWLHRGLLTLQSAIAAINVGLDEEHTLQTYTWELSNLLNANGCIVFAWDADNESINSLTAYQSETWENTPLLTDMTFSVKSYPFLKRVIAERYAKQWHSQAKDIGSGERAYLQLFSAKSLLILPLIFQDQILGLVQILKDQASAAYTDQEIAVAQLLTDQAASSLVNARLYSELVAKNESLRISNAELDAFDHTVAHDLKGPLNTILGFSELLSQEFDFLSPDKITEFLNTISHNSHTMKSIIDSLLMLASIRKKRLRQRPLI